MLAMRSPTLPVNASKDLECLSFTIHVLYSFWRTSFSVRGKMLPWQLVEAQEPGPVYLPAPSGAVARVCEKLLGERTLHSSRAAESTRNKPRDFDSSLVFMCRLAGVLYPKFECEKP